MPWAVTDQGSNSSTSGATIVLTIAADIAVDSIVVVGICDQSHVASGGSMIDSAGNSYSPIVSAANNADTAKGFGAVWYTVTEFALTGGSSTITYTKVTSGAKSVISALSAAGGTFFNPLDTSVTASATAAASPCTVTSGTPSVIGDLFVGFCTCGSGRVLTSDAGHGWTSPPLDFVATGVAGNDMTSVGAYEVNSGTGTIIYSPTSSSDPAALASFIVGFTSFDPSTIQILNIPQPRLVSKRMVGY